MSLPGTPIHQLRLAGVSGAQELEAWHQRQAQRLAVVKENRLAAHAPQLDVSDPLLRLAGQTRLELQGPVLTPERRKRLLKLANRIGVRPFDASLIIAIEQDRARCEPSAPELMPIPCQSDEHRKHKTWHWGLASLMAALLAALAIRWLASS
jgi:hypothetical protein